MTNKLIFEQPVIEAINQGQKVIAIKLLRESRGIGLKEAKDLVEQHCEGVRGVVSAVQNSNHLSSHSNFDQSVIDAISRGQKIEAIKLLRVSKGIGLKESKQLVEQYMGDNDNNVQSSGDSHFSSYVVFAIISGLVAYFCYKLLVD